MSSAIGITGRKRMKRRNSTEKTPKVPKKVKISTIEGLGFPVTPSVGNFILAHFRKDKGRSAKDADAFLRSRGLIVRAVAGYGLPDALRITVGATPENDALLAALADFATS